jgi:hypothetical protein
VKSLIAALLIVCLGGTLRAEGIAQLKFLLGDWQAIDTGSGENGSFT